MLHYPSKTKFLPDEETAGAQLTVGERRALLEEIGHVALTLGQSLAAASPAAPAPSSPADCASNDRHISPRSSPPLNVITASPALLSRPEALTSPQERLYFLTALWSHLEPAFRVIARHPDTRMLACPQPVLLARSRGSAVAAHAVARDPRLAAAWQPLQTTYEAGTLSTQPLETTPTSRVQITERMQALTVNTWGNRLAVTLLTQFEEEAVLLGRLAAFCDAPLETAMAARLTAAVRRLRTQTFLRDCRPFSEQEASGAYSAEQALRCAPPYRVLYQGWTALHRPLDFDWTHSPLLTLPALEPWHLYEIWCLLQVGSALCHAGWQLVGSTLLRATPRGLRLALAAGRDSRLDFTRDEGGDRSSGTQAASIARNPLSLYYQPLFASANQAQANRNRNREDEREGDEERDETDALPGKRKTGRFAFCSRSHAMQPDIVLHHNGKLYVLDPKFKVYVTPEEAQDDVNKMHAYRDAIVPRRPRAANRMSAVEAAWCLFPGASPGPSEEREAAAFSANTIIAYPAAAARHPYGTAGIGAFQLRPGQPDTAGRLAAFLTFLLTP